MKSLINLCGALLLLTICSHVSAADWYHIRKGSVEQSIWDTVKGKEPEVAFQCYRTGGPANVIQDAIHNGLRYRAEDIEAGGVVVESTIYVQKPHGCAELESRGETVDLLRAADLGCHYGGTFGPYYRSIERCQRAASRIDPDPNNLRRYE
jgi:hypothetical protein